MPEKPISPLRQRMNDDMTARRFTEHAQRNYVRTVKNITAFLPRSPDKASTGRRQSKFLAVPAVLASARMGRADHGMLQRR